jgi:enterochelin esterase-like enzyme
MKQNLILALLVAIACGVSPFTARTQSPAHLMPVSQVSTFADQLAAFPEDRRDPAVWGFIEEFPLSPVIESDTVASIYFYGKAALVLVNGDLQGGWSAPDTMLSVACGDKSFFYISYHLPANARVDYQLVIDGQYQTDPRNTFITPSGYGPHSELAMPGFRSDPSRAHFADVPRGSVDSLFFTSKNPEILPRKIKVYLPAGYESLLAMPVLYVMDGLEALTWMNYPTVLDNLIAWKKIRPVIAVFIPPVDRGGEMMEVLKEEFLDVLCDEIVPLIDKTYATDPIPASRGITGISAGGFLALYAVLTRNSVIACGAGQSPAISEEIHETAKTLAKKEMNISGLKIYYDMGQYDLSKGLMGEKTFVETGIDLSREMTEYNLGHRFQVVNDGHEWANWRERTDEILQYFFPAGK